MNITLDFTQNKSLANLASTELPVAIMPAELAKKLLKMYANSLGNTSNAIIIDKHIDQLHTCANENDLDGAIVASVAWLAERELIQNIFHENWDAYTVSNSVLNGEVSLPNL